ncbi:PucR family transcriptional regulator [Geodermatophilus sp. CPCC 206100]|uniref:PucR family transcriptional regulator n=1 Tax=Geodermatophilus sp. CPCC 206100 TaxID=3020054 RepID=UPI003B00A81F
MNNEVVVADLLDLPTLAGTSVVAGAAGLDRPVRNVSVVAGSEITQWVKPRAALFSTGHPLREHQADMPQVIRELDERSVACIAIRLGRYLDDFPPGLLETAEELRLPVIRLTDSFAFDDILIDVLRRINAGLVADLDLAERVHAVLADIVMSGGTAVRVASEAARLFSAEVALLDATGVPIAPPAPQSTAPAADWRVLESSARDPRTGTEPVESVVLRLGGPVDLLGYLTARRRGRPFSSAEVRALERSAAVAALALAQQAAVRDVESHFQSEILGRLLRGEFDDADAAAARFSELGWRLDCPLVVASIAVWPSEGGRQRGPRAALWLRSTGLALLRESLQGPGSTGASGTVADQLAVVVPATETARLTGALQRVIDGFHRRPAEDLRHGISAGLSVECRELLDAPRALRQAQVAARAARRRPGPARPCAFSELGALGMVLAASSDEDAPQLATDVLAPLDALPAREANGLLTTLRALVVDNMTLADVARALHCHYNTVRHRARRLEELLGPFSADADLRLNLALALRLQEFGAERG